MYAQYIPQFAQKYTVEKAEVPNQAGNQRAGQDLFDRLLYLIPNLRACPDHIHILVEIPPKMSISGFMGFLKGKSSLMIYEKWGNMKYKYRNRQFWCRGYYVSTVGRNEKVIKAYIANQLKEDSEMEEMTLDFGDPFTGSKK